VGGAWGIFNHTDLVASASQNFMVLFEVTPRIMGQACFVATLLGIVASIAPSLSVARMSVVEGLKTLD
jgi:ABC-type antimicrobial peptide transport system permease subunit